MYIVWCVFKGVTLRVQDVLNVKRLNDWQRMYACKCQGEGKGWFYYPFSIVYVCELMHARNTFVLWKYLRVYFYYFRQPLATVLWCEYKFKLFQKCEVGQMWWIPNTHKLGLPSPRRKSDAVFTRQWWLFLKAKTTTSIHPVLPVVCWRNADIVYGRYNRLAEPIRCLYK